MHLLCMAGQDVNQTCTALWVLNLLLGMTVMGTEVHDLLYITN